MIWIVGDWHPDDVLISSFKQAIGRDQDVAALSVGEITHQQIKPSDILLLAISDRSRKASIETVLRLGAQSILYITPEASMPVTTAMSYCKNFHNVKDITGNSEYHLRKFLSRLHWILRGDDRKRAHEIVIATPKKDRPILIFPATPYDPLLDFRSGLENGLDSERFRLHDPSSQSTGRMLLSHLREFLMQADALFLNARRRPHGAERESLNVWIELGMAIEQGKDWRIFRQASDDRALPSNIQGCICEEYEDPLDLAAQMHFDLKVKP